VATIDDAIEFALNSEDNAQRTLGLVFKNYREMMGRTKATDMADIIEQQAQLWSGLRAGISSKSSFRDCVQFILSVFRENQDGAFTLPMLLRGVDVVGENGPRFNATHREAYVGLVSLLEAAAGMNNPQQVAKTINVAQALKSEAFSAETRQRLIGFFTA
jgi:uncharacterized protein (DUF2267 family)